MKKSPPPPPPKKKTKKKNSILNTVNYPHSIPDLDTNKLHNANVE